MTQIKSTIFRSFYRTFCTEKNSALALKNNEIIPNVINNRNPRNLERMRIAYKPAGYHLERKGRDFWHKVLISRNSRSITGYVQHNTGKIVVSASSSEWSINRHLYTAIDLSAYISIARVLAQRCLEAGLNEVACDFSKIEELHSQKLIAFVKTLGEEGLILTEPPRYIHPNTWDQHRPEKPWEVLE